VFNDLLNLCLIRHFLHRHNHRKIPKPTSSRGFY
jgi:hypothetical protein